MQLSAMGVGTAVGWTTILEKSPSSLTRCWRSNSSIPPPPSLKSYLSLPIMRSPRPYHKLSAINTSFGPYKPSGRKAGHEIQVDEAGHSYVVRMKVGCDPEYLDEEMAMEAQTTSKKRWRKAAATLLIILILSSGLGFYFIPYNQKAHES